MSRDSTSKRAHFLLSPVLSMQDASSSPPDCAQDYRKRERAHLCAELGPLCRAGRIDRAPTIPQACDQLRHATTMGVGV